MRRLTPLLFSRCLALGLSFTFASSEAIASDTQGRVSGTVIGNDAKPLAQALVTMHSPSETETDTSDAQGHFAFVSLKPDVYTLTVAHVGYGSETRTDVLVQADVIKDESIRLSPQLSEIGHVRPRSRSSLVQPGVTSDVTSITTSQQNASQALGGGNQRDSIISSLATVPGVMVPVGQAPGWGQSVYIRGGEYTQTGYEFDGVPLNRPFDQYSQNSLSSFGTQEIQVYTGAAPIDQQAEGIGGYINQVVKSGSYPNTATVNVGIGGPAFYNQSSLEFSGADGPDQKFTYYLGLDGYGFSQRIIGQYNGAGSVANYGPIGGYIPATCGPNNTSGSCYANGNTSNYIGGLPIQPNGYLTLPTYWGDEPGGRDNEMVGNFHFAIPHHRDKDSDDLQFLYANSQSRSTPNASISELGTAYTQEYQPFYIDQNFYTGPLNGPLTNNQLGLVGNSFYHGHTGVGYNDPLDSNQSDSQLNEFSLGKLSYRHNIGTDANMRVTLYDDQSNEWQNGIVGLFLPFAYGAEVSDYALSSQTTGIDLAFTKQMNAQHLVNFDLSESTTKALRVNNLTAGFEGTSPIAMLVDGNNPTGGCYGLDGNGNPVLTDCASSAAASYVLPAVGPLGAGYQLQPSATTNLSIANAGGSTCGTGPCTFYSVSDGSNALVSSLSSRFSSMSVSDHITPSQKLALDLGLRYDLFQYYGANTNTPSNRLWVNTFNQLNCINGTDIEANPNPGGSCSAVGAGYTATNLTAASHNLTYGELSPRLGAVYTLDPNNVFRLSYGRYVQPAPVSAEESTNSGPSYPDPTRYAVYGENSPTLDIKPEVSYNMDLSWEHQFNDNATSMKVTPFYRTTKDEFASIVIDPKTNFSAMINGLDRQSSGLELALKHGDFKKNGFSMLLAYTFTHAMAQFAQSPTGGSFVTAANQAIQNFNSFTSFCASNSGSGLCSPSAVVPAAPCYTAANASNGSFGLPAASCGAGTIANPYWNAKPVSLLDPKGSYAAYDQALASGAGGGSTSNTIPNVATLVVNYRHNRFSITPSMQYEAGARYGSPLASQGVNPASCSASLNSSTIGDPRYSSGIASVASAASPYDASSCSNVMAIPNPYTGSFDSIGEYRQPSLLTLNLQMSYDASKNTTIQFTAANLFYRCFGGSNVPWSSGNLGCNYQQASPYVGNVYNPGDSVQQIAQFPYAPTMSSIVQSNTAGAPLPLEVYLNMKIKL